MSANNSATNDDSQPEGMATDRPLAGCRNRAFVGGFVHTQIQNTAGGSTMNMPTTPAAESNSVTDAIQVATTNPGPASGPVA